MKLSKQKKIFFKTHFGNCTAFPINIEESWPAILKIINDRFWDNDSLDKATDFCDKWGIKKSNVIDVSIIFYLLRECDEFRYHCPKEIEMNNFHDVLLELKNTIEKYNKVHNATEFNFENESTLDSINFIGIRNDDGIKIKDKSVIAFIIWAIEDKLKQDRYNYQKKSGKISISKLRTSDIRTFSYGIFCYLNNYTQYTSPKNNSATNEQCRIIYDILYRGGLVKYVMDEEDYIRAYLKQVFTSSSKSKKKNS